MSVCERRPEPARVSKYALALLVGVSLAACFGEAPSGAGADVVRRCTVGMKQALRERSRGDALQTYQQACSGLFDDAACRAALKKAAGNVSGDWLSGSLSACAKSYCPRLSPDVRACKADPVEGPDAIDRTWVELSHAILRRGDERRAGGIVFAFARFFADLNAHMPPRIGAHGASAEAVESCERGIERAATLPSHRDQRKAYYEECASVYEGECRAAFKRAATVDPGQQEAVVLVGCRKTYCPWLSGPGIEACDEEFVPTREAVMHAWPLLNRAILQLDAKQYAARLTRAVSSLEDNRPRDGGRGPSE